MGHWPLSNLLSCWWAYVWIQDLFVRIAVIWWVNGQMQWPLSHPHSPPLLLVPTINVTNLHSSPHGANCRVFYRCLTHAVNLQQRLFGFKCSRHDSLWSQDRCIVFQWLVFIRCRKISFCFSFLSDINEAEILPSHETTLLLLNTDACDKSSLMLSSLLSNATHTLYISRRRSPLTSSLLTLPEFSFLPPCSSVERCWKRQPLFCFAYQKLVYRRSLQI